MRIAALSAADAPQYRELMQAAIGAAGTRAGLRTLRLTVTQGNDAAIRLYEAVGFTAWGVEPMAILTPSGYKAKAHMAMDLGVPQAR